MTEPSPAPSHGTRYLVVGGGVPSPEQLAALTVALTPVVVAEPEPPAPRPATPPWALAAIHEATGGPPLAAAPDLQRLRR